MPFRITSILVASDLSPGASHVLRSAAALAELAEAELHVAHVVESNGLLEPDFASVEVANIALREQLDAALPASARATSVRVEGGRPHRVILDLADEVRADLIVVGPHRGATPAPQVLGTTADRLARTSEVPLLIIHGPISLPLRSVLIPTDLSDAAEGALDVGLIWTAALRHPRGSDTQTVVHMLLAVPPVPDERAGEPRHTASARELHRHVEEACERTGCGPSLKIEEEVAEGDATELILKRAKERAADLVVLGTHGHGALARALIGSVSSAVARRAECPVLLVPPRYWQERREREERLRR
ncbi:MAG: universal stress protein [Candidatus Cloacimonetes bacterium]|jgi:nucleotide-binding universal stress UspA family protein|nr:universal stress protein [Candidatus Cloacimonadota bacterium]